MIFMNEFDKAMVSKHGFIKLESDGFEWLILETMYRKLAIEQIKIKYPLDYQARLMELSLEYMIDEAKK